ncbi:MAG: hypothetical protein ACRC2H_06650, partial [Silanimonas sp.]
MNSTKAGARWPIPAGLLATAALIAIYAGVENAWPLGVVALVPWLLALERADTWRGAAWQGLAMSVLFTASAFWWCGLAVGQFTGVGTGVASVALLVAAPLLQPQIFAFALVRHAVGRKHGALRRALAGAAAWVATEALWPK